MGVGTSVVRARSAGDHRDLFGSTAEAAWVVSATVGTMIVVCGALIARRRWHA